MLLVEYLRKQGVLAAIEERVRFARGRFGHYEVIDFLAVLFGYAISGERTLEAFYERLAPFAEPFMALFNREQLPSRSALSRFLASFTPAAVEALRVLFLEDLLTHLLTKEGQRGELRDRAGGQWEVFDIDGTREAARQRALPKMEDLPPAQRRLEEVCAAGYTGRKRGEVVRTRTVVSQAHTSQWLGSFGNRGNGEYRKELARALLVIRRYLAANGQPQTRVLLRLDGHDAHWGHHCRSGWPLLRDARQRLRGVGSPDRAGAAPLAPRCLLQSPGKPPGAHALRLPRCPCGEDGRLLPRRGGDPPGDREKVPHRSHPQGRGKRHSFSPISRKMASPPPMSWHSTCIVARVPRCLPMKITNRTRIAGAAMHPLDKKPGKSSVNGSGTYAWSWAISLSRLRCAPPPLLLPSPQSDRLRLCPRALLPLRGACPGKRTASLVKTFLASPMGPCGVPLVSHWLPMNNAEKPMGACASSMRPVSGVAVPVPCASSVNGMAKKLPNLAR